MTSPGNSFKNLRAGSTTRYGEEPANSTSIIVGKFIKSLKVRLRKAGNPKGPVNARIRRKTDDAIVATFIETVQSNNLGISFADYTFTLTAAYNITSGDRILIEFPGQNAQHGIDIEIWGTEKFDGANTRGVSYQTATLLHQQRTWWVNVIIIGYLNYVFSVTQVAEPIFYSRALS